MRAKQRRLSSKFPARCHFYPHCWRKRTKESWGWVMLNRSPEILGREKVAFIPWAVIISKCCVAISLNSVLHPLLKISSWVAWTQTFGFGIVLCRCDNEWKWFSSEEQWNCQCYHVMLILSGSQIRTLSVACCEQTSEESRGGSGFSVRVVVFHVFDSNQGSS